VVGDVSGADLMPVKPGWRYEVDPYAWIPIDVSGNAMVRGREIPIDANLGDLLENFDLGAMARFEAWASSAFGQAILGGRVPLRLSRMWGLGVRGGIGIPGVGWSTLGWVELDPTKWLGIIAAYRVEHLEYSGDRVGMSATAQGPYLGVGFRFGSTSIY
jgi:hypothetical protein